MTEPKSKRDSAAGILSETAKTHLVDVYVSQRYGRNDDVTTKYTEKGLMVEEDAITLYCRIKKQFLKKNKDLVGNGFLRGTPDLYEGTDILAADRIIDVKSSWDIYTFSRVRTKEINNLYWWQLQGYMALTGAKTSTLAYCLIDTPEVLINDEKRKLMWKMGVISDTDSTYQEACEELDRNMRFGDIPLEERMIEFTIERDDDAIEEMYDKIKRGRIFLDQLHQSITNGKEVVYA